MYYAYCDRDYIVMSRLGPQTSRAERDCIRSFASREEALAWAAAQPETVIWRP